MLEYMLIRVYVTAQGSIKGKRPTREESLKISKIVIFSQGESFGLKALWAIALKLSSWELSSSLP